MQNTHAVLSFKNKGTYSLDLTPLKLYRVMWHVHSCVSCDIDTLCDPPPTPTPPPPPYSMKPMEYDTAQLVGHQTAKPGTILMQVRFPAETSDFSPRVNFQCRLSCCVLTAPMCNHMHQHLRACKDPKHWQPNHCWTHENTAHTGRKG